MANEKFRVKFGLAVGDTAATIDATSGDIVTTGDLDVKGANITNSTGALTIATTSNGNLTLDPDGTGKVIIAGDLQVDGTTTTVNSTTLDVDDINITIAKGAANAAAANGGGITLEGPTTAATITYASADDSWNFNKKTTTPELQVDNINVNGNSIISTDTNGNINLTPDGTGRTSVARLSTTSPRITTSIDDANGNELLLLTATGSAVNELTLANAATGSSPTITASGGDSNVGINIVAKGTGDVALTFNNGGNLTNTRNYVFGAIRNTTTDSNGDIWVLDADAGGAGTLPYRGVSIDNSADTAKNAGTLLRNYSNTSAFAGRLIFERARGTAASPTTLSSGDQLGAIGASGYSSTLGWINDTLPVQPANMVFSTAEAWVNNTNLGTTFAMNLTPTATTVTTAANLVQVINHNPQAATYRSDAFTFRQGKTGTTDLLTLGTSTSTLSSNQINIQASAVTAIPYRSSIRPSTGSNDAEATLATASTDGSKKSTFNFAGYRFDGTNLSATQQNDVLGEYKFNGNTATSGSSPSVPGAPGANIVAAATENWTSGANGTNISFSAIKTGTLTSVELIKATATGTVFKADSYTFQDSAGTNITGNKITYNRVYGQWQYDATITPAASNTAYAYPIAGASGATDYANIASVGSTSHIIPGALGMYKLQFSLQLANADNGAEHTAYIWWRKNGTDIPSSMGRVGIPKGSSTIAGWDNMIEVTNTADYWEMMYAVDDTQVTLPYYAATAFGPATASLFITLVPVGA
jgi:hypothetical protein